VGPPSERTDLVFPWPRTARTLLVRFALKVSAYLCSFATQKGAQLSLTQEGGPTC